jgi:hypothetical protein
MPFRSVKEIGPGGRDLVSAAQFERHPVDAGLWEIPLSEEDQQPAIG